MDNKTHDFYKRLKVQLDQSTSWPAPYLFKFIVPSNENIVLKIENAFDGMGAVIKTSRSKTGKFTSISVDIRAKSSDEIINKYLEMSKIEGIISL